MGSFILNVDFMYVVLIYVLPTLLILEKSFAQDQCRHLEFRPTGVYRGKRLINHVINTAEITEESPCRIQCYMEPNCVSYNFIRRGDVENHICELNNSTHQGHEVDLKENPACLYREAMDFCRHNLCKNKATCQTGFTKRGYRCLCLAAFEGENCEKDIDECAAGTHSCSANAVCNNTKGSYNCTCKPGYQGDGRNCQDIDECAAGTHECSTNATCNNVKGSYNCTCNPGFVGNGRICGGSRCKDIYDENYLAKENKAYELNVGLQTIPVYCHMNESGLGACGGGGWTLVMKIDGAQTNFVYDSTLWSNNETFNLAGGKTGFDAQETKLPTYWNTSFSKICLGMKIGQHINFIVINKEASSLFSLIADGQHRKTSLGRDTWKMLIGSAATLQQKCNREGFNAFSDHSSHSKARIGIIGNNENDCTSSDYRIGFGCGGWPANYKACGNVDITAMGYILVQ